MESSYKCLIFKVKVKYLLAIESRYLIVYPLYEMDDWDYFLTPVPRCIYSPFIIKIIRPDGKGFVCVKEPST